MQTSQTALDSLRRTTRSPASRRRQAGPLLVLLIFLLGVAGLFALVFGDRLRPRVEVTVAPVLLLETGGGSASAAAEGPVTMIAQASGWIEPDPYPVRVPVKTDGFVDTVEVLEGQSVRKGDLLATLDAATLRIEASEQQAMLAEAEAALAERELSIKAALAEAAAAEARLAEAADRSRRLHALTDEDVSPVERIATDRAETEARAANESARVAVDMLRVQSDMQRARVTAAQAALDRIRLDLERTRVVAPMDGIVLALHAAPGLKRMAGMEDMESSSIVTLYDPSRMQARVDVPLSDIGRIVTGMSARVVTAALANRIFTGVVTRITGAADLTRNTLQVKVALRDPDPRLRPEMLCRAEFLAPVSSAGGASGDASRALWIPAAALVDGGGAVWVIDPVRETAERRPVTTGAEERDGLRQVIEGLRPGEKVVTGGAERLRPGARVIVKEDLKS
ncbi:MAG TPA: efflux RND transporter periplasmic adaptor subunit [Kiritimatiellia bacterium]|nr:efflux RND transporter periplasmic adaptor subunit [Kiritimatiellia bacterium]